MVKACNFWDYLYKNGFDFFSGVPCSFFKSALEAIVLDRRIKYVPAVKEDIALGVASGVYLAGGKSGILMQNSGLGHIVNALTSFNLIYKIPVLIFVSWRGYQGKDAPEHIIMGAKTIVLLKDLGIPYRILSKDFKKDILWAINCMKNRSIPVVLVVKEGVIQ